MTRSLLHNTGQPGRETVDLADALAAAHAAERTMHRLRESRAPERVLEHAETACNRAWAVVGELDRPAVARLGAIEPQRAGRAAA